MFESVIGKRREGAVASILGHYRELYLPQTILVPSARFGLYALAKELFSVGDRILVSPITCRTVICALLAAGVSPIFVDIDVQTGNIDITKIGKGLLRRVKGVITTNLYGNPDHVVELKRIAEMHGLLVIEDCAHVLHTSIAGREVGAVGDVSIFSFKKYFGEPGGVVTTRDEVTALRIRERVMKESRQPVPKKEVLRFLQYDLSRVTTPSLTRRLASVYRSLDEMVTAGRNNSLGGSQEGLRNVTGSGDTTCREFPTTASLLRVVECILQRQTLLSERMAKTRDLIKRCPLPVKKSCYADEVCYLVVPFFSSRRDEVVQKLKECGIPTYFLYNPPMNRLFCDGLKSEDRLDFDVIDEWSRKILPIDVTYSDQYLEAIYSMFGKAMPTRNDRAIPQGRE